MSELYDKFGNCTECGGGTEGSIEHMPDCPRLTQQKSTFETLMNGLDEVEAYLKDDRLTCPSCGEKINDEMGHMCPPLCPDCGAPLVGGANMSGVKCSKCPYWFCY